MSQEPAKLTELLGALRRRRGLMLAAFAIVLSIVIPATIFWPPLYRATGTILIEQQELPPDLVRSAISSFADQRIQVITQRVMTTENLFKIIEHYDLYPKLRQTAPREKIIERMHDDISFEMISADVIDPKVGRPTKATIAFSVSYRNRSPEVAARVANELVSLYLRVNIESRKEDAANAADFMSGQTQLLSKHIDELQASIATFKQRHLNSLPDQSALNSQLLYHASDDIRDVDSQIRALDQQITYLEAQLAQISPSSQVYTSTGERVLSPADRLKFLRTEYARVSALYSARHPDVLRLKREIEGLEKSVGGVNSVNDLSRQLQDTQLQLTTAQQKYGPDHPDVLRLERQVAALQKQLQSESAKPSQPSSESSEPDNPAYIELKAQRESAINQRASLQQKRDELKAKSAEFEGRLARAPDVERDYAALLRDLDNARMSYNVMRQKEVEADQSKNLEDERKGEKFTLIEPPVTPERPASPNRLAILIVGLFLAIAAAFGSMFMAENLDTSVRNRRDLEALLGTPPLAVVPWIQTNAGRRAQMRWKLITMAGTASLLIIALSLTHFLFMPLDVLWRVALRHLG